MAKFDEDSTFGSKLLKLFRILLADQRKHYLKDLKESLNCSSQTVLRLMSEIERELGSNLEMGKNGRLRWYRLAPQNKTGRLIVYRQGFGRVAPTIRAPRIFILKVLYPLPAKL